MAFIRNTTGDGSEAGHVVHLVAGVSSPDAAGRQVVTYLKLPGMAVPGIPPTEDGFEIDNLVAQKIQNHKSNALLLGSDVVITDVKQHVAKKGRRKAG